MSFVRLFSSESGHDLYIKMMLDISSTTDEKPTSIILSLLKTSAANETSSNILTSRPRPLRLEDNNPRNNFIVLLLPYDLIVMFSVHIIGSTAV